MQFVGKVITSVSEFYKDINPSTLSGAIDVLVVEDANTGRLSCSPFHVRFGKLQLLRPQEKIVEMRVNSQLTDVRMKVGEAGETFFVLPTRAAVSAEYLTSPLVTALPGAASTVEPLQLSPTKGNTSNGAPLRLPVDSDDGEDGGVKSEGEAPRSAGANGEVLLGGRKKYAHTSAIPPNDRAALSDSEVEATRPNNNSNTRATAVHDGDKVSYGGHEQYSSWLWGGLPQRQAQSGEGEAVGQGSDQSPEQDQIQAQAAKERALLEYLHRPEVIRRNYEKLRERLPPTGTGGGEGMPDSHPIIYRVVGMGAAMPSQSSPSVPLPLPWLEDDGSLSTDLSPLLGEPVAWDGTTRALNVLLSNLCGIGADASSIHHPPSAFPSSGRWTCLILSWFGCHFPGHAGLALVLGRTLFGRLSPLEDLLSLASSDGGHGPALGETTAASKTETVGGTIEANVHVDVSATGSTSAASGTTVTANTRRSSWRWWSRAPTTVTSGDEPPLSPPRSEKGREGGGTVTTTTTTATGTATSPLTQALNVPLPPSPTTGPLSSPSSYSSDEEASGAAGAGGGATATGMTRPREQEPGVYYKKSLRLPHEMLQRLNLQPGVNSISFTVSTRLQGTATCTARIFRWRSDTRIIISDIDGTITKSDALGHLFTFVGKDWTHANIARLYSSIARNGYHFIYLSSRSLGQANVTRGYLKGVEQNKFQLPDGPVIMSPDRLLAALRREVVLGIPQEFKIACLRDLQQLFYDCQPPEEEHANPFYAGFGNRTNDAAAYLAIGIPPPRVFIINPAGTVSVEPLADRYASSYAQLIELVDSIFPPLSRAPMATEEPYNDFWYWRRPVSLAPLTGDPQMRANSENELLSIDYYGKVGNGGGASLPNPLYVLASDNASGAGGVAAVAIGGNVGTGPGAGGSLLSMGGDGIETGETLMNMSMIRGGEATTRGEETSQRRGANNGGRNGTGKGRRVGRGGENEVGRDENDHSDEDEEEEEEGLIPAYYA